MEAPSARCFVCGMCDRRALTSIVLGDASEVVVCGSHALMARRAPVMPRTDYQLRALFRERRVVRRDRRSEDVDTLAVALRVGFAGDRRNRVDRRSN